MRGGTGREVLFWTSGLPALGLCTAAGDSIRCDIELGYHGRDAAACAGACAGTCAGAVLCCGLCTGGAGEMCDGGNGLGTGTSLCSREWSAASDLVCCNGDLRLLAAYAVTGLCTRGGLTVIDTADSGCGGGLVAGFDGVAMGSAALGATVWRAGRLMPASHSSRHGVQVNAKSSLALSSLYCLSVMRSQAMWTQRPQPSHSIIGDVSASWYSIRHTGQGWCSSPAPVRSQRKHWLYPSAQRVTDGPLAPQSQHLAQLC